MLKALSTIAFLLLTTNAHAELPTVAGIKFGGQVGKDVPLCGVKRPQLYSCIKPPATNEAEGSREKSDYQQCLLNGKPVAVQEKDIVAPANGGICVTPLPEYSLEGDRDRYKVWHAKPTVFGKIQEIDTFKGRVWYAQLNLQSHQLSGFNNVDAYIENITWAVNNFTLLKPVVKKKEYDCGARGAPKTCWLDLSKTWTTPEATFVLEYARPDSVGTFTVTAKFGMRSNKDSVYEPLLK